MGLPFCTAGELGAIVLHESLGCKGPSLSLGEGYTGKFAGGGDITSPERR